MAGEDGPVGLPRPAWSVRRRDGVCSGGPAERWGRTGPPRSERLQRLLLFLHDLEELVELGDLEHLVDLRVDVTQDQFALGGLQLLVQGDELAERRAGEVFDVAEIQEDLAAAVLVDEAEELLADDLDVLLVQDLA